MVGSFTDGQLGMGVAFVLEDYFSNTSKDITRSMGQLELYTEQMTARITRSLNMLKIGAAMAVVGGLILAPFVANIGRASDLSESLNKNAVIFGDNMGRINDFIFQQAAAYGMSKNEAAAALGVYGNLFTALGMGADKAAGFSVEITKLAADLASFNNTDIQSAMDALRSGMTGEYESLKKYGIAIKEELLKQQALSMGLINSTKDAMSPLVKMQATYQLIMAQTQNAQGDFIRTGDGYANVQRKISARIEDIKTSLGGVLLPIVTKAAIAFEKLLYAGAKFAESPLGAAIMRIAFVLGVLLVVGGLVLVLLGGLRFLALKAAFAFGEQTAATIITAFATRGLAGGMYELAVATWTALAPLLPFIAAFVAIVAVVYLVYNAMDKMNTAVEEGGDALKNYVAQMNPVERFFARVGTVLSAMWQIWKSWNGETFTLTEGLARQLQELGILEFIIDLATWIVRIKEFFKGMWSMITLVLGFIWNEFKKFANNIYEGAIKPLLGFLEKLGIHIGRNTSDLDKWATAGKVFGVIMLLAISPVIIAFVVLGMTALAALAPIILVIVAVITVIWAIWYAITHVGEAWDWLKKKAVEAIVGIIVWFGNLIGSVENWGSKAYQAGANFVQSLWDGIKSGWSQFVGWLDQKISETPILGQMYGAGKFTANAISNYFGDENPDVGAPAGVTPAYVAPTYGRGGMFNDMARMKGAGAGGTTNYYPQNASDNNNGQIIIPIHLDGDKISEKMIERQDFSNARKSTE